MQRITRVRQGIAVATAVGALMAPTASAAPIEELIPSSVTPRPSDQSAPVRIVERDAKGGFDWADAGIGGAGALALAAIASGAVIATRRRPDPGHIVT